MSEAKFYRNLDENTPATSDSVSISSEFVLEIKLEKIGPLNSGATSHYLEIFAILYDQDGKYLAWTSIYYTLGTPI